MRRVICLTMTLILGVAGWGQARPSPGSAVDGLTISLRPPRGGAEGKVEIRMAKRRVLEEIDKAIPGTVDLPEQKLGNQLIYRDVRLGDLKAKGLKPTSMTLESGVFHIAGRPEVVGNVKALYEHAVIRMELRTVAKVFGREIKTDVPVHHSDWRPKGDAPFSITAEVQGTAKVSFNGSGALRDQRLRIETRADYVKITDVRLKSDDVMYKIVKEVVGIVGQAFPNEGFNKPIKDALTRSFDVDPFRNLKPDELADLDQFGVKNVRVITTDAEVKVIGDLFVR